MTSQTISEDWLKNIPTVVENSRGNIIRETYPDGSEYTYMLCKPKSEDSYTNKTFKDKIGTTYLCVDYNSSYKLGTNNYQPYVSLKVVESPVFLVGTTLWVAVDAVKELCEEVS